MTTSAILEKRTSESIKYDINCSLLLDADETISGSATFTASATGLVFGSSNVNSQPLTYDDGTTVAVGKVLQVRISAGTIPAGQTSQTYTIHAVFSTSSGNTREATVLLMVTDQAS